MFPRLYSFRRCPYAIRARLAIASAGLRCELREVVLRNKPEALLALSPKGTVPVLEFQEGQALEESLDIMRWALHQHDPEGWLDADDAEMMSLIRENDEPFKFHLDRAKYPHRYPEASGMDHRHEACGFLLRLEERLRNHTHLFDNRPRLADMAIFPFVRQFARIDPEWFQETNLSHVRRWLEGCLASPLFPSVMAKYEPWAVGAKPVFFPAES
jgi:glutathione S-transferase